MIATNGLNLPPVVVAIPGRLPALPAYAVTKSSQDWWPSKEYVWSVDQMPGDRTLVTVTIHPFQYRAATKESRFYKTWQFAFESRQSTISVNRMTTGKGEYTSGEPVDITFYVENVSTQAVDVLVESVITRGGVTVGGLPLHTLTSVQGITRLLSEWTGTGAASGTYALETTLRTMDGVVLDRETCTFNLKAQACAITSVDMVPVGFRRGQDVLLSVTVTNPASEEISGVLVISVQNAAGKVVKEFHHNVNELAPGTVRSWTSLWTVAELVPRDCRVLAYLLENGATSGTFCRDWTEAPLLWDSIQPDAAGVVLRWPSVAGRMYTVECSPDLAGYAFSNLVVNLPATPPQNVHTDTVPWPQGFYRLREQW